MAIQELSGAQLMYEQIERLLYRASQVKQTSTIDPPLPKTEFSGEKGIAPLPSQEKVHLTLVEVSVRRLFYETVAAFEIDAPEFVRIWNLLDILTICGDQDQCDPALAWWLIEELLDTKSVEDCRIVFDYLDSRRTRLIAHYFAKKQLVILRAFNDLLRRVSRAENAVFCGRILTYLFQSFELGGRGAVNHRGEYNVDNVTTFSSNVGVLDQELYDNDTEMTDVEPLAENASTATEEVSVAITKPISQESTSLAKIYSIFWSLQGFFSNPPQVLNAEKLQAFKDGLELTLKKFKEVPKIIETTTANPTLTQDRASIGIDAPTNLADAYNPKFLTSPDLFELELSDLAFQRDVLVQSLILIDFLQSQTEDMKSAITKMAQSKSQSDFTLTPEDLAWAEEEKRNIGRYLRDGPDGMQYSRMVDTILFRDTNWVKWKANNCPAISKDVVPSKEFQVCKDETKKLCATKRLRPTPMGTLDLRFLSEGEREQSLDRLRVSQRPDVPVIDGLVRNIETTELDLDFASGEERSRLESVKESQSWSALRVGVRQAFSRLDKVDGGHNLRGLLSTDESQKAGEDTMIAEDADSTGNQSGEGNANGADDSVLLANEAMGLSALEGDQ